MQQVFFTKKGAVEVVDVAAPDCGPHELLVAVHFSVISAGTETKTISKSDSEKRAQQVALARRGLELLADEGANALLKKVRDRGNLHSAPGYSAAGIVVAVGSRVEGFRVGDRVACAGAGYACHAEVIRVPPMLVAPVPEEVSLRDAAWSTVGAIALQGLRRANPNLGEVVVITGLGLLGQLSVQLAKAFGAKVVALDPNPARVARAAALGADAALDSGDYGSIDRAISGLSDGIGADVVLLCATTQSNEPLDRALSMVRQRGRVVVVGDVGMTVDRGPFFRKEVELTISCSYGPGRYDKSYEEDGKDYPAGFVRWTENRNLRSFISAVGAGQVTPGRLVTHEHPVAEAASAYGALVDPDVEAMGVLLRYPAAEGAAKAPDLRRVISRPDSGRSPSDALRVAVIGVGGFAKRVHLPGVDKHRGLALHTVVSRTGISAEQAARTFDAVTASTDWQATVDDPSIDVVIIATRHDSHAEIAAAALTAGKHVLVEKPLALDHPEIERVLEAQRRGGGVLLVGHNRRYAGASSSIREAIRRRGGPIQVLYRVNAGEIPGDHWTQDPLVGGGRLIGEGSHFVDLVNYLVGDDIDILSAQVQAIPVDGRRVAARDNYVATLAFADGSIGTIVYASTGSKLMAKERIEVFSSGASFVLDDFSKVEVYGDRSKPWKSWRQDKGFDGQLAAFVRAIRGELDAIPSYEAQARAARLVVDLDLALRTPDAGDDG